MATNVNGKLEQRQAQALEIFAKWNAIAGAVSPGSHLFEIESIIEDAVFVGMYGRPPADSRKFLDGAGDLDSEGRAPTRTLTLHLEEFMKGPELDAIVQACKFIKGVTEVELGPLHSNGSRLAS